MPGRGSPLLDPLRAADASGGEEGGKAPSIFHEKSSGAVNPLCSPYPYRGTWGRWHVAPPGDYAAVGNAKPNWCLEQRTGTTGTG